MNFKRSFAALAAALMFHLAAPFSPAQTRAVQPAPSKVILDTDIGDDIDDAFAVALALSSPEVHVVGITSAWGDTALRSRLLERLLCETGRSDIPVYAGIPTKSKTKFTQKPWAEAGAASPHTDAVSFLLDQARRYPGQITLIAIAPLTNLGAAIDRDPVAFRKFRRVVLMGGSIHRGYDLGHGPTSEPDAEYNIASDPAAAKKLFSSGVHIDMMPLDSTQVKFDEVKRSLLASVSTPLTDALQILTAEWQRNSGYATPTLYDAVAAAYAIDPATCPATPLHIAVDDKGFTRATPGTPNANVCLEPHPSALFHLLMPRLLDQKMTGRQSCTVR